MSAGKVFAFDRVARIEGRLRPQPDKSITHRALFLSLMAKGASLIHSPLLSLDTMASCEMLQALGAELDISSNKISVSSPGMKALKNPDKAIDCANSATTARLGMGVAAAGGVNATFTGDSSLSARPMARVTEPLRLMGADIQGGTLPVSIKGARLHPAHISGTLPSAQVKSAMLLAMCGAEGVSSYTESYPTRDHTERMLPLFGVESHREGLKTTINGGRMLTPAELTVPGDFSSAAFYIAAAFMFPGSRLELQSVGLNPTRTAFLDILRSWGADIDITGDEKLHEPLGDITAIFSPLTGGEISGNMSTAAIDELPLLGMLGLFSENGVLVKDAKELRLKETDRIAVLLRNMQAIGADTEEYEDGFFIAPLKAVKQTAPLHSARDHRLAMINILLSKRWGVRLFEEELGVPAISNPGFTESLNNLEVY